MYINVNDNEIDNKIGYMCKNKRKKGKGES